MKSEVKNTEVTGGGNKGPSKWVIRERLNLMVTRIWGGDGWKTKIDCI